MTFGRIGAAALCVAALLVLPGSASGATTNVNACAYSYDPYWRDMDVTMAGTVVAAAGGPGVTVQSPSIDVSLPSWLAKYGFDFQLLKAGRNEIPVRVWFATRGTNTVEGTQVQAFETTAETYITASGTTFVDATPIEYVVPALAAQQWTRRGGPVEFRQAGSGSLPPLPTGPDGRLQQPKGSLVISAALGGGAVLTLDCVPGTSIGQGGDRVEATSAPFATVDAPALSCLSALPTNGVRLEMANERGLVAAYANKTYSYAPAVSYQLSNAYLRALFDAGRLTVGDNALALSFTAAVDGAGTRAVLGGPDVGPVTVRVGAGATPIQVFTATGTGIVESADLAGTARLNAWSGLPGTGPLGFASAGPGGLGALTVAGVTGTVRPYGSLYARASITPAGGGSVNRLSFDCVSGGVTVNSAVPYSELGDQEGGDRGRYTIAPYQLDPFATAYIEPDVTPRVTPTPTAPPTQTATPLPTASATPAPTVAPTPTVTAKAGAVSVKSKSLKVASNRVSASLGCAGATSCRGTVTLRTTAKVKRKYVTLANAVKYTIAAGTSVTVRLSLSGAGKQHLRGKRRVSVALDVKPTSGKTVTKQLTLTR